MAILSHVIPNEFQFNTFKNLAIPSQLKKKNL